MMDKIPDRPHMILDLFRERQCFAYQATNALPQRVVQSLDATGLSARFADGPMAFRRQHAGVRIPKIAVADGTLAINGWQRFPQGPGCRFITGTDGDPDNFSCVAVKGQPHPLFVPFVAHKRPPFITFDGQPSFLGIVPGSGAVGQHISH